MVVDITKLIAAINPDVYCDDTPDEKGKKLSDKVKEIVKEKSYLEAAKEAELKSSDFVDIDEIRVIKGPVALEGLKNPLEQHELVYDVFSQNLEPLYFWILDYVNKVYGSSEKLVDNFLASPGSGHFAEMSQRATILHDKVMSIFGTANQVIRSILNIIYDLKEFRIRLAEYERSHSSDEKIRHAASLALKQIWLDSVDIKRQNTSIKGMAQQFDYVTLIDAFMITDSVDKLKELDLNDRVKRILEQRLVEYELWIKESERELKKRFEIEKVYLKSQVNSLKLYARWLKPYLRAATQLEQRATPTADIVTAFNTSIFELVLLARGRYNPQRDIELGDISELYKKLIEKKQVRTYTPILIVEISFRSVPDRAEQRGGYGFRGKAKINFTSFALNDDELQVLKEQIDKDDVSDVFELIEGATEKSLGELKTDIEELLGEKEEKEEEKNKENEDTNPFTALFSGWSWEKKDEKKDLSKGIPKDDEFEKILRSQAILASRDSCRKLYKEFKRSLGMISFEL